MNEIDPHFCDSILTRKQPHITSFNSFDPKKEFPKATSLKSTYHVLGIMKRIKTAPLPSLDVYDTCNSLGENT